MTWLFFALLAPLVWGYVNVIDTVIRRHYFKNEITLAWLVGLNRIPGFLILWAIFGFEFPGWQPVSILVFMGMLWLLSLLFIFKAYEFESPTRVILMVQMTPVVTLLLAQFLLGESLSPFQWIAFLLLLGASFLGSLKHMDGRFHMSKAILLALFTTLCWAAANVGYKYAIPAFESPFSGMAVYFFGAFIASQLLWAMPNVRPLMMNDLRSLNSKGIKLISTAMIGGILGSFSFAYALTLGKVSLTTVILGVQPLSVFLFSLVLVRFVREVHQEDTSLTALLFKGLSLILVIVGLYLMQF